jgi:hypothetical protein
MYIPVCTASAESMSVSWFSTLSDSKQQLLNCEPSDEFLEWYADEVEEEWNGGREGVSETCRVCFL